MLSKFPLKTRMTLHMLFLSTLKAAPIWLMCKAPSALRTTVKMLPQNIKPVVKHKNKAPLKKEWLSEYKGNI